MQRSTPHQPISGRENSTIRLLRSLSDAKHRKKERAFLAEGLKLVEDALRSSSQVRMVVAAPSLMQHHGKAILKLAEPRGIEVVWVTEKLLDQISESKTPQPVMAVIAVPEAPEEALFSSAAGLIVLCHQLQDPGNLGTIIRTAEAAGAAGVAVTGSTVDPFSPKAVRASMGSVLRLPVARIHDASDFLMACQRKGYQTAALALEGGTTPYDMDLRKPTLIILGQEGSGLPDEIIAAADLTVRIPMAGTIDSLNVATSAAVFLYEAVRQRMK